MKYIVWERTGEFPCAVMFTRRLKHKDLARNLGMLNDGIEILGAGFVRIINGEVKCSGFSISLDATSRGTADEEVINVDYAIGDPFGAYL